MKVNRRFVVGMFVVAPFVLGCCCNERKRITLLTADGEVLGAQLAEAKAKLVASDEEIARCREALSSANAKADALQGGIAKTQEAGKPVAGWEQQGEAAMKSLPERVLFEPGKADLKNEAFAHLNRIVDEIRQNFPGHEIYVMGHTDSDPIRKSGWKDNLALSLQRAATVTRYLVKQGLNAKQIVTAGAGEFRPVAANTTNSGKASNRRVEFLVLKPL